MSFDVLSLDELTDLVVASFANLLPDKNVARNSDNWKRLRVLAGAITDLHAHIDSVRRDASPLTAKGAALDAWGYLFDVTRKGATPASADSAGLVRGTAGSSWATTDTLVHKSGLTFKPTASGTLVTGEALVGVIGISTGPETRLAAGEVLTWETTPAGLEDEVELQAELASGGDAEEDDGAYRVRILDRIGLPAKGGAASDWKAWIEESADYIRTGYVYPNRNGLGSVDVAALKAGTGSARLLDAGERTALLAVLDSKRPVAAAARVLEVLTQTQNVEVKLTPEIDPQWGRDWDDATPLVVSSWTAATRTLVFTTARPASMAVGHRVVVAGTSGVELVIESLSGADGVVLVDAKGQTPAATENVYSGGPLVAPVRDAIIALINELGPRVGPYGHGDWEGSLRMSRLFETVQTQDGVLDSEFVTPTATVEPTAETFHDDPQVRLLIPGNILARYA